MSSRIDPASPLPKYAQLQQILKERIASGRLAVGQKLPTEQELMKAYRLSSATVGRALREMVRDGFVTRRRGHGSFVSAVRPAGRAAGRSRKGRLLADCLGCEAERVDSLNWFIVSELQRGIVNTYAGTVTIVGAGQLENELRAGGVSGVILADPSEEWVESLAKRDIPHVLVWQRNKTPPEHNVVCSDHLTGVYEGMSYLIKDLGHRAVALISGGHAAHQDRRAGYEISLRTFGIPFRGKWVVNSGGGTSEHGYKAMKKLLASAPRPTAVFVDTDIKAVGALEAVRDAGLKVPDDISMMGFDDVPGMQEAQPPLTTIRAPHYELGCEAVRMLERRIKTRADVPGVALRTKLVVRASCGKA